MRRFAPAPRRVSPHATMVALIPCPPTRVRVRVRVSVSVRVRVRVRVSVRLRVRVRIRNRVRACLLEPRAQVVELRLDLSHARYVALLDDDEGQQRAADHHGAQHDARPPARHGAPLLTYYY